MKIKIFKVTEIFRQMDLTEDNKICNDKIVYASNHEDNISTGNGDFELISVNKIKLPLMYKNVQLTK